MYEIIKYLPIVWKEKEEIKDVKFLLNIKVGTRITDIWKEAKKVIGKIPHQEPFINRYEIETQQDEFRAPMPKWVNNRVVSRFHELQKSDVLILVNC